MPPKRRMFTSSMLSAPAHIPAINVASFGAGFAAPEATFDASTETFCVISSCNLVCLRQRHDRDQPGARHDAVLVEHSRTLDKPVGHFHRECLS